MPELSIILPVYKMEKFLPRVIASIKAQTMRDFEAIFVDDGSPDNSGAICLASAADDSRFRVITRETAVFRRRVTLRLMPRRANT